jgi:hypothetical protein
MKTMKAQRTLVGALMTCLVCLAAAQPGRGVQRTVKDDPPEEPKRLNEAIEKSVNWYDLLPDADATTTLTPVPVMRWRNVVRGQEGEAMMVVWPHNGRPVAMASIYPWNGKMNHEFDSLAREKKPIARDGDRVIWSPAAVGVEFKDVPKAPKPAKTAPERLRQMKTIAEGFTATMTGWAANNSDQEVLRLLPRPLHRYDLTRAKEPDPKLLDGALFAYVLGTDPEVVLVLEAIGTKDEPVPKAPGESPKKEDAVWQFAFVRATSGGLEVKLGDAVVWSAAKHPVVRDPKLPHFTMQRVFEK